MNGTTWNQAGTFTDSLVVTGLAPYAWNYSVTPSQAPALTATFDWFHNLALRWDAGGGDSNLYPCERNQFLYNVKCVHCR